ARPTAGGLSAGAMLAQPLKAYMVLHAEMDLDAHDAPQALAAMHGAEFVVALAAYRHDAAAKYAQVLLPIAPFTETAGTFINTEGRVQSFQGVVRPLGEARPAWKVLRVLGNLTGLSGFSFDTIEQVRTECLGGAGEVAALLSNEIRGELAKVQAQAPRGIQRIGE